MSDSRDKWLRQQLRNVQLPEELIARLKQISRATDSELDAAIRDVPAPSALLTRLKRVPADEALDQKLIAVEAPAGLADRLREIPQYADVHLDADLSDIPVPSGLSASLRDIARHDPVRQPVWQRSAVLYWAVAASLMVAVGLSYFSVFSAVTQSVYLASGATQPSDDLFTVRARLDWSDPPGLVQEATAEIESVPEPTNPKFDITLATPQNERLPASRVAELGELFAVRSGTPEALLDVFMQSANLFAFEVSDTQYELTTVAGLEPRGIAPPAVKGFDLVALLRDGVHPFAAPGEHAELRKSRVPLVTSIDSFDAAQRSIAAGRLPEPSEVRVEEFLAAIDYEFPEPRDQALAIRTAAGPSPFGEERMNLLQVGVQATSLPGGAQPSHMTLAIDISASMQRGGRFRAVQRGVGELAEQLGPHDRLSIVIFGEHAQTIVEDARHEDAAAVARALAELPPSASTNVAAGLQLAAASSLGSEAGDGRQRRLVLVTDGLGDLSRATVAQLADLVTQIEQSGATLDLIDVTESGRPRATRQLNQLAAMAGGRVYPVEGGGAVAMATLEILTGKSPVLAVDAQLIVEFNPETVSRYRLLGHEADAMGGMASGPMSTTLYAGQTATALYELELNAYGGDDVATATVVWRDPESGATNRVGPQRISRLQFATSLLESPVSLQRAALAAETAEVLRGSAFAGNTTSGLRQILDRSAELPTRTVDTPSMHELISLVGQADQIRSGRPARPRTPPLFWLRPR